MILKVHPTYTNVVIQKQPVKDFDQAIDLSVELKRKYPPRRNRLDIGYRVYCYVKSLAGQIKVKEND